MGRAVAVDGVLAEYIPGSPDALAHVPARQALRTFGSCDEPYVRMPQGWARTRFFNAARKGYLA